MLRVALLILGVALAVTIAVVLLAWLVLQHVERRKDNDDE